MPRRSPNLSKLNSYEFFTTVSDFALRQPSSAKIEEGPRAQSTDSDFEQDGQMTCSTLRSSLCAIIVVGTLNAGARADPLVSIKSDTKQFKDGVFAQTLILENSGDMDAKDTVITSQPYNRLKEPEKAGFDAATQQKKIVNVPAHSSKIVTFTFNFADAKDWKWRYTDVYKDFAHHEFYKDKSGEIISADNGAWDCTKLIAGPNDPSVSQDVPLFYPNAVDAINDGAPENFAFRIDHIFMPPGWSLAAFDPAPGEIFTLSHDSVTTLHMTIDTPSIVFAGQEAEVDYRLTELADGLDYHGVFCVDVQSPEPTAAQIAVAGVAVLVGFVYGRRAMRNVNTTVA